MTRINKSEIFDSSTLFPYTYDICRKRGNEKGFKYMLWNDRVYCIPTGMEIKEYVIVDISEKDIAGYKDIRRFIDEHSKIMACYSNNSGYYQVVLVTSSDDYYHIEDDITFAKHALLIGMTYARIFQLPLVDRTNFENLTLDEKQMEEWDIPKSFKNYDLDDKMLAHVTDIDITYVVGGEKRIKEYGRESHLVIIMDTLELVSDMEKVSSEGVHSKVILHTEQGKVIYEYDGEWVLFEGGSVLA